MGNELVYLLGEPYLTDPVSTDQESMGKSHKKSKTNSGTKNTKKNKKMGTFVSCEETGLYNFGNICYMNSAIQILRMCDSFDRKIRNSNPCKEQKVLSKLQEVFSVMDGYKGKNMAYNPRDLYDVAVPPWFASGRQQDSSEFLRHLLNTIQEEELQDNRGLKPEETIAESTFGGKLKTIWKCKDCKSSNKTTETFFDLSLTLPNPKKSDEASSRASSSPEILTLQDLIKTFQSKEEVQGKMKCKNCQSTTRTTRKTIIAKYPEYLIVTLGRFLVDEFGHAEKDIRHIEYPRTYKVSQDEEEIYYGLTGVVVHMGQTLQSGHYCCFARHQKLKVDDKTLNDQVDVLNDEWFYLDDDFVRSSSLETLQSRVYGSKTPYILVYKRTGKSSSVDGSLGEPMDVEISGRPSEPVNCEQRLTTNESGREKKHQETEQQGQREESCLGVIPHFEDLDDKTLLGIAHLAVNAAEGIMLSLNMEENLDPSTDNLFTLLKRWAQTESSSVQTLKDVLKFLGFEITQEKEVSTEENDSCNVDDTPSNASTMKLNESSGNVAVHSTSAGTTERGDAISDVATPGLSKAVTADKHAEVGVSEVEMKCMIPDFSDVSDDTLYSLALEDGYSFEELAKKLKVYSIDLKTTQSLFTEDKICANYSVMKSWKHWCTSRSEEQVKILKDAFHKIGVEMCTAVTAKTARVNKAVEKVEYFQTLSEETVTKLAQSHGTWWKQVGQLLNVEDYDLYNIQKACDNDKTACKKMISKFEDRTWRNSKSERAELIRKTFAKLGIKVEKSSSNKDVPTGNQYSCKCTAENHSDKLQEKSVIPDFSDVSYDTLYGLAKLQGYSWEDLGRELHVNTYFLERAHALYGEDKICTNYSVMKTWLFYYKKSEDQQIKKLKDAFSRIDFKTSSDYSITVMGYQTDVTVKYFQTLSEETVAKLAQNHGTWWKQVGQLLNVEDYDLYDIKKASDSDKTAFKEMVSKFEDRTWRNSKSERAELIRKAFVKLGIIVEKASSSKDQGTTIVKRDISDAGVRSTLESNPSSRQSSSNRHSSSHVANNYF